VIQSIYGLGLSLENALLSLNEDSIEAKQRVQATIDGLNQVIRDLRSYILDLKPRQMGEDGLIGGVKRLIAEFKANTFAEVSLVSPEKWLKDLPEPHSLALFHICQEALANAAKHAKAKNVQIALWKTKDRALMEIRDDGIGFDMDKINANIGHGLTNMQARVQSVGGDVEISSHHNDGTTVFAWVPRQARA
jgi:signal transduction histidine kinase